MSDAFYTKMATTARKLIAKFGVTYTVTRNASYEEDPVTGAVTAGTETEFSPKGLLTEYDNAMIDGTTIQHGDRLLVLDDTVEPNLKTDTISVGGKDLNCVRVMPKNPAGVALVYFVQVRG